MKKNLIILLMLLSIQLTKAQTQYKTVSGLVFSIGDIIKIGQPLSHLGWKSIYTKRGETYITNKNLISKEATITAIDTINKPVNFSIDYKRKIFKVDIDEALRNKEIIPQVQLSSVKPSKYDRLIQLKELLDKEIITEEEFENEKSKILETE